MFKIFKQVFSSMRYIAIAGAGTLGFLAVSAILPNLQIIKWAMGAEAMVAGEKLYFLANVIIGVYKIDLVSFATFFTFAIATLFGVNIAMAVYYFKNKGVALKQSGATGFLGAFAGFLGVGCSACGSVALSFFSSFIGIGGALAYLPFGGRELAVLSIFLLVLSIYQISRNISAPRTCH